jgi:hypothetical protein
MEPAELVATIATLVAVRSRRVPAVLNGLALDTVLAKLPVWALLIKPINERTSKWNPRDVPPDWRQMRDRWHGFHAFRFALSAAGSAALLAAALADCR